MAVVWGHHLEVKVPESSVSVFAIAAHWLLTICSVLLECPAVLFLFGFVNPLLLQPIPPCVLLISSDGSTISRVIQAKLAACILIY